MKPGTFITILILLVSASCQKQDENTLLVIDTQAGKVTTHNLSEVFKETEQIALGTTIPLINYVKKVVKTRNYLFITDPNATVGGTRVLKFNREGKFIKQIGNIGQGPEEYYHFHDFAIDTINDNVLIASFNQLLCYDFDGRFVNSIPLNVTEGASFYTDFLTCISDQVWTFQHMVFGNDNDGWVYFGDLVRYDENLSVIDTTNILRSELNSLQHSNFFNAYLLSNLDNEKYVYYRMTDAEPFLRDTLYLLTGFIKKPALRFDFEDILSIDETIVLNAIKDPQDKLEAIHKIRNVTIANIYRTTNYAFVEYHILFEPYLFCYNLLLDEGYNMKEGFTDDIFNTGIAEIKPMDLQNGEFYFVKNGYEVEETIDGVNEGSNPVIFFLKIKEELF